MVDSREISSKILSDVFYGKSFEKALLTNKEYSRLDQRDKSLVSLLVLTSLRRNGQINIVLSKFIKKPLKKNFIVNYLLKISVAQILYLEFPEYSTVHSAVEISKKYKSEKFTNAVLRNICKNKKHLIKNIPTTNNIPDWIKNGLKDFLGEKRLASIAAKSAHQSKEDLRCSTRN